MIIEIIIKMEIETNFFSNVKTATAKITDAQADYCIDVSGSTSGSILRLEKMSAEQLMDYIPMRKLIGWDSSAKQLENIDQLYSGGWTDPQVIVPHIRDAKFVVLYTDGCIKEKEMQEFTVEMTIKIKDVPIIVVFTMAPVYTTEHTVADLQKQVNMSIPEACLTLSSNVCLVVNISGDHRVLMRKGCFNMYAQPKLENDTKLKDLPIFDMTMLNKANIASLPAGMVWLDTFDKPLVLEKLYAAERIPDEILGKLCNRAYFPNLDLDRMHVLLCKMQLVLTENPKLVELRKKLSEIAVSDLAGGEEHKKLIQDYNVLRREGHHVTKTRTLQLINRFQSELADYRIDKTSFVLGSNRANRAAIIDNADLDNLGECVQIEECPIYLQEGDACILLKATDKETNKAEAMKEFTSDYAMEAPFEFGTWLTQCMTPGVFCAEIAKSLDQNPYTREPVLGFLPLSKDPLVVMRHMCKMFAGNREMWHMLRGYISMVVHAMDKEWINSEIMLEHLCVLFDNYNTTLDLKGGGHQGWGVGGTEKVPLKQAFQNVLTNYSVCLRDRFPDDVRAIISIAEKVMPELHFEKTEILGMANVVEAFSVMLRKHKQHEDMRPYLMEVDDYDHYLCSKTDVQALVAHIFWRDDYTGLKLQLAVDRALTDRKFGSQLKNAFVGKAIDESIFTVACKEPTGVHFSDEKYNVWTRDGLLKSQCIFCGERFVDANQKNSHMRKAYGAHFYNGHLTVLETMTELGSAQDSKTLFKEVKKRLFRKYGEQAGFLHTQHCKKRMLQMIETMKTHSVGRSVSGTIDQSLGQHLGRNMKNVDYYFK